MLCMRWGGSIVGTCEVGLAELSENRGARAVAKVDCGVLCRRGLWLDWREDTYLDAPGVRKATGRR
jgi:hypothetical protein